MEYNQKGKKGDAQIGIIVKRNWHFDLIVRRKDSVSFYKKLDFFQDSVLKIEGTYYEKKRSDSIKGTRILLAEMNIDEKGYVVDISIKSGTNIPFSREQEEKFKELFIRQKLFSPGTRLMVPIKTHKVIVYQIK